MSFRIDPALDPEKVFLVRRSGIRRRLDPAFYRPYFRRRHVELDYGTSDVLPLGKIHGKIFQGVTRNLIDGASTVLLKVKNISADGTIDFVDTEPVDGVPKSKLLRPKDIISPFIGAAIKQYKFALFQGSTQDYAVDNNVGVIRIEDERVTPEFLLTFFRTELVRWQLDQLTGGGGVPFLGSEYARQIRVPIPSPEVQQEAIARLTFAEEVQRKAEQQARGLLSSIDSVVLSELGVALRTKLPNQIENRMFRRRMRDLSGNRWDPNYSLYITRFLEEVKTSSFPVKKLRDYISLAQYGISERATDEVVGVPMLRMLNLQDSGWELSDMKYIAMNDQERKPYLLERGDILFNRTNSKELVGKCGIFDLDGEYVFASYLVRVRLKNECELLPEYVVIYLGSSLGRLLIDAISRQIVGMTNINAEEIRDLLIPVPPRPIQGRLCERVAQIRYQATVLRTQAAGELEAAKKTIAAFILGAAS